MSDYYRERWEWDSEGTRGFNLFSAFEATLLNFGLQKDYNNIDDTETFDKKYGYSVEKEMNNIKGNIKSLQDQLDKFADMFNSLSRDIDSLREDILRHDHDREFSTIEDKISDLESDLVTFSSDLSHSFTTLENIVDANSNDIATLGNEVADLTLLR